MGRPPTGRAKRNCIIRSSVNLEERKQIETVAANYNLTVSAFIRAVCLDPDLSLSVSAERLATIQEESLKAQML